MSELKISIIVPVYKVELYLERCVKSLVNQTYKNLQIILVDDGSPDRCPEICDNFSKSDLRIEVIHRKNGGLSVARNSGIERVTGDYIMFVDSDDFIELDSCEHFIDAIKKNGSIDIVVGAIKEIKTDKVTFQRHSNIDENRLYSANEYIKKSIQAGEWYAPAWINMYNAKWFKENKFKYTEGIYFEDLDILPLIFLNAKTIMYIDYPFYNYCIRDSSIMTSGISDKKKQDSFMIMEKWFSIFSNVKDKKLKGKLFYWLSRSYIHLANYEKIFIDKYPSGLNFAFLLCHCGNFLGLLKTLHFYFKRAKRK